MRWTDDGIYLSGRAHGESSVIADIFTRGHGRTLGLVKGGRSRRLRPLLQTGNSLAVDWRARLDEQLGVYTIELAHSSTALLLDDVFALQGVLAIVSLLQGMAERDPHPQIFDAGLSCIGQAGHRSFAASIVRFELLMLEALGYGLNLESCAATGSRENLIYVSPRSGQAVTAEAGHPYRDRLFALPSFLVSDGTAGPGDIVMAFNLTGFFVERHLYADHGKALPVPRQTFVAMVRERSDAESTSDVSVARSCDCETEGHEPSTPGL